MLHVPLPLQMLALLVIVWIVARVLLDHHGLLQVRLECLELLPWPTRVEVVHVELEDDAPLLVSEEVRGCGTLRHAAALLQRSAHELRKVLRGLPSSVELPDHLLTARVLVKPLSWWLVVDLLVLRCV